MHCTEGPIKNIQSVILHQDLKKKNSELSMLTEIFKHILWVFEQGQRKQIGDIGNIEIHLFF